MEFLRSIQGQCVLTSRETNIDIHFQVLSGEEFLNGMIRLVEPLSDEVTRNQRWVTLQKENEPNSIDLMVGTMT